MTKKENTEAKEANENTIEKFYANVDRKVNEFAKELMDILPTSRETSMNSMIIIDRILSIKESAKFLINNHFSIEAVKAAALKAEKAKVAAEEKLAGVQQEMKIVEPQEEKSE